MDRVNTSILELFLDHFIKEYIKLMILGRKKSDTKVINL